MPKPPEKSARKQASAMLSHMDGNVLRTKIHTKKYIEDCKKRCKLLRNANKTEQQHQYVEAFEKWHRYTYLPRIPYKENGVEARDDAFWRDTLFTSTFHRELLMQLK